MNLQLIRNATLRVTYNNHIILIDPYFAPKHSLRSYTGKSPNPLVDLPMSIDEILAGVELVVISHLHSDHFDSVAQERVPKHLPIFCQPGDENFIRGKGFQNVTPVEEYVTWENISLSRTPGQHGTTEKTIDLMKNVSGFVFKGPGEPNFYWAGDTIWYTPLEDVIQFHQPNVIVTHSSGAVWEDDPHPIVMNAEQTISVCRFAPNAYVVATHLEALDHGQVSRAELRAAAESAGLSPYQLFIPEDGEVLKF